MQIKELEYLPAERVALAGGAVIQNVDVSLYGHWVHVRSHDGHVESMPASGILAIRWAWR